MGKEILGRLLFVASIVILALLFYHLPMNHSMWSFVPFIAFVIFIIFKYIASCADQDVSILLIILSIIALIIGIISIVDGEFLWGVGAIAYALISLAANIMGPGKDTHTYSFDNVIGSDGKIRSHLRKPYTKLGGTRPDERKR